MSLGRFVLAPLAILCASTGLVGCPDPNAGMPPATDPANAGSEKGPAQPTNAPPASSPDAAHFSNTADDGLELSGTFEYAGEKSGAYRMDFLQFEEGTPPRLVHTLQLREVGEWKIFVPTNYGALHIVAFIDLTGDGPSPDDPAGTTSEPIVIAADPVTSIIIELLDEADLGSLTPGAQPPTPGEGAPGANQHNAAPEGSPHPDGEQAPPPPPNPEAAGAAPDASADQGEGEETTPPDDENAPQTTPDQP